ncbi:MAG: sulfatase-like hydrolase/transferase, partial [Candidatus Micrarchaeia archaeon]
KIAVNVLKEDPDLFLEAAATAAVLTPLAFLKKAKAKFIDGWPIEKGGRNIIKKTESARFRKPFFLFVNLMEAHDPYVGDKSRDFDWSTPFMERRPDDKLVRLWRSLYDKAAVRAYAYAARISKSIAEKGDAIILFTSDHGQMLGEHDFFGHGTVLYDEVVRVPLAVKMPKGYENEERAGYQSLVNFRRFLGAAVSGKADSTSLLSAREVRSESFSIPANIRSVKGVSKKLIQRYDKKQVRRFLWTG